MKKILVKILFKLLGLKISNTPILVDGNDFIIKFNNTFYIMTGYSMEEKIGEGVELNINFTDILSRLDKDKKRWDF